MNLDNLDVGMKVKNYPELCRLLEIKVRTGVARKNQLSWIEDYIRYEKEGHKFIIKDIYADLEVMPMVDNRGGDRSDNTHIEYIEKLVLDMLVQDRSDGEIFLSKTKLFEALDMVNENYGYCSGQQLKTSKYLDVAHLNVEEWFSSTGGVLERSLNKALNKLKNQSLIFWSKKITVREVIPVVAHADVKSIVVTDLTGEETESFKAEIRSSATRETIREAIKEEVQYILHTEREVMKEMGWDGKQNVVAKGKWKEFQKLVKDRLLKEINIGQYWQSYHVVFNPKHVKEGADDLNKKLLPYGDRDEYKRLLNIAIQDSTNTNAENRSRNASKKLDIDNLENAARFKRRADESYISDSVKLSDTLLNKKTGDLVDDIKKINPYK